MGLTYNSRTIADAKVLDIFGAQGVGCYQLNFSLEFNLPNWEPADEKAILGNLRADIAVGANRGSLKRIGEAGSRHCPSADAIVAIGISDKRFKSLDHLARQGDISAVMLRI